MAVERPRRGAGCAEIGSESGSVRRRAQGSAPLVVIGRGHDDCIVRFGTVKSYASRKEMELVISLSPRPFSDDCSK